MTSEELAAMVEDFYKKGASRVLGTGREQYERDGEQNFEKMSLEQLFRETQEELQDVGVYTVMLSIRLSRLADRMKRIQEEADPALD